MKRVIFLLLSGVLAVQTLSVQASTAVDSLLQSYRQQGVSRADATAGQRFWNQGFTVQGETRRCATCHTSDPRQSGKHAATGKVVDPLAPSVNPKRLTDIDEINKWFTRNCKWTLERECTPQEKADVLEYLKAL